MRLSYELPKSRVWYVSISHEPQAKCNTVYIKFQNLFFVYWSRHSISKSHLIQFCIFLFLLRFSVYLFIFTYNLSLLNNYVSFISLIMYLMFTVSSIIQYRIIFIPIIYFLGTLNLILTYLSPCSILTPCIKTSLFALKYRIMNISHTLSLQWL